MNYQIRKYQKGEEKKISGFIKRVYDEFVSGDYVEEGNRYFYEWISPEKIAERQKKTKTIHVAVIGNELAGVIEIRDNQNISLLFVDKKFQGRGIARKLFQIALEECREINPLLCKFYVHASPFSIPVYEKLGFSAANEMQETFGIKYLPMEMEL